MKLPQPRRNIEDLAMMIIVGAAVAALVLVLLTALQ